MSALRESLVRHVVLYKGLTQINLNLSEITSAALQSWMKDIAQGFLLWSGGHDEEIHWQQEVSIYINKLTFDTGFLKHFRIMKPGVD